MKKIAKCFTCLMAVFGVLSVFSVQAATITWEAFDITDSVADISTKGTLVVAKQGGASSVIVNGVTFGGTNTVGNLFDSLFKADTIGVRGFGTVVSNATYRAFLGSGQRSGWLGHTTPPCTEPTQLWTTIKLTGLTVGATYELQIWASDNRADIPGQKGLLLGNGSAGDPVLGGDIILFYEVAEDGAGQYAIGTFTADATTQNINVRCWKDLLTTPAAMVDNHFSNGWQLRKLTDPAKRK